MVDLKFRISTGLKDIIGKELINDDHIAIFELVKNSYDAKAHHVKIIFYNILGASSNAKIFIVDDGNGMSLEDIEKKWLAVGFSEKKFQIPKEIIDKNGKISTKNRAFAGAKGIGRFSADRLGRFMVMYTRQTSNQKLNKIELDWKDFEKDQEKNFESIDVHYSDDAIVPKEVLRYGKFGKGTILEISNLNSRWDEKNLLSLKRYLQRLINPTIERNINDFRIEMISNDFEESDKKKKEQVDKVNGLIQNIVFEKFEKQTTRVSCKIVDGKIFTSVVDKGSMIFELEEDNPYSKLNNVYVHIFYLTPPARTTFTKLMGITHREYGSVFLYKNGFRIHPYGNTMEGDDWLELEQRKGQGYARFLSNREIIGRVEIYGEQLGFKETSSRAGGIIGSESLTQLKKFIIKKAFIRLEKYIVDGLHWDPEEVEKQKSPEKIASDSIKLISKFVGKSETSNLKITIGKDLYKKIQEHQGDSIPEIIQNLEVVKKSAKSPKEKEFIENQIRSLRSVSTNISKTHKQIEEDLEIKTKETYFLRKASSGDKQIIMNLNHSIQNLTKKIDGYVLRIGTLIQNGEKIESIIPFLDKISIENKKVKSLAKIVTVSNFNIKARTKEDDLVEYMKEYTMTIIKEITSLNLTFYNGDIEFDTKFIPLEISTMLDNFIDNSIKAGANKISIRFEKRKDDLCIYFADNGKGIPANNEKYLFTRGYTTTSGSGLGIYHIKSIAEEHGGSAKFVGNNHKNLGKGAVFEVILHGSK